MFTRGKFARYQTNPQNIKIQTKLFYYKNSKLCTLNKLVYTFALRHNLASRAFPRAIISVVCTEFPVGSKFFSVFLIFLNGKLIFPNLF